MNHPDHAARLNALAVELAASGYAAAAIVPGPNFLQLTGLDLHLMERPTLLLVTAEASAKAIIPVVERTNWMRAMPDTETYFWADSDGYAEAFEAVFKPLTGTLAVEGLRMRVRERDAIAAANGAIPIIDAQDLISSIRLRKSESDLEVVRKAIEISEAALQATVDQITLGMTETRLKRILLRELLENGADGPAFDPIVLFGASAADCHGHSSNDTTLKRGDAVLIDFGAAFGSYNADITRTFFARAVADEDRALYEAVLAANEIGREIACPGLTASDLDKAVTQKLRDAGFSEHIVHKTGHGLGIDVHEAPQVMVGNEQRFEPGMLFTIEPGLYIPGRVGIRIEDNVVITPSGSESLSSFSRDLKLVG